MKITLLYQVSHYIKVKKQRNIKSWDQQNYLVIRGFCYIRPRYNEVPLYDLCIRLYCILNLILMIFYKCSHIILYHIFLSCCCLCSYHSQSSSSWARWPTSWRSTTGQSTPRSASTLPSGSWTANPSPSGPRVIRSWRNGWEKSQDAIKMRHTTDCPPKKITVGLSASITFKIVN